MEEKIHIIWYHASEVDDVYSGYDEIPLFFSTEECKAIDFFNNRVSIAHNDIKKHESVSEIWNDEPKNFEYCIGNWAYAYRMASYPMNTDLQFHHDKDY